MRHVFSATIIVIGLLNYAGGVGSIYLIGPEQGISHFLMVLGGLTTLFGLRIQRSYSDPKLNLTKSLGLVSFFVFIGCTVLALAMIFASTDVSMFVMVFSMGCAMLTALIQGMLEQTREQTHSV